MIVPEGDHRFGRTKDNDPWMTLAQAVRWAAWPTQPEPRSGSVDFGIGAWADHGDMEEQDRLVYINGAERVRHALASGQLEAWGQEGYNEPEILPRARWSAHIGSTVSWVEFYHPFDRIIVERAKVHWLWPPNESAPADHRHASTAQPSKRSGRPKGSGSMAAADEPLLQEMRQLISAGEAFSANGAAIAVASKAKGAGTQDSRAARLAKRYLASEKN